MSILNQQHKRHVRIVSKPDELIGWKVLITDVETGEEIHNVFKAVITLDARELNAVELFYYEADEQTGRLFTGEDGGPIERSMKCHYPEVALDAWEVMK
jgi:hypothetical protein